jgi:Flp pilus assembly protein TadG
MSPSKTRKRNFGRFTGRFAAACEGMVAVEFALIAPVMITTFFAVSELSDGLEAGTKVTQVASTAADLVGQEKTICDAEMNDVFAALNALMFPYATNNMGIRISSLIDGGNGVVKVAWSDAQNMAPRTVNSAVTVPAGLIVSNSGGSAIFAEVGYTYTSTFGIWLHGAQPVADQFYEHPRKVLQVARTSACT